MKLTMPFGGDSKLHDDKINNPDVSEHEVHPLNISDDERRRLEKKLVRKIDLRMLILVVIYILNYVDRNNVPVARSNGLEKDLSLTGTEYPTLLSLLYVGYILFQIPSNMIVERTGRPSLYLPICIIIWGLISLLFYLVRDFTGAVVARFFLGIIEAAFFPGAVFLLSKWYTKKELALRTAILYCGSLISNAFGPLIGAGIIGGMNDNLGIATWRWLFIIEGAMTMFIGFLTILILPDFPHNSRGFTPEERKLAVLRMAEDAGQSDSDETSTWKAFVSAMLDYRMHLMALTLTAMVIGLSFNAFFPTLTGTLGYGHIETLLLAAPPFIFATLVAFANARHSDATQERYWHIIWPLVVGIIGFIIAISTSVLAARYVALFLMAASYASFVVFYAWISSSFPRPPMRRGIIIAYINCFSQLGNVSGSYVYPARWGPSYHYSFGIAIAMFGVTIIGSTIHRWNLARLNREIEALEQERAAQAVYMDNKTLGEQHGGKLPHSLDVVPGFRYML